MVHVTGLIYKTQFYNKNIKMERFLCMTFTICVGRVCINFVRKNQRYLKHKVARTPKGSFKIKRPTV
jgi:hypothetical protein